MKKHVFSSTKEGIWVGKCGGPAQIPKFRVFNSVTFIMFILRFMSVVMVISYTIFFKDSIIILTLFVLP